MLSNGLIDMMKSLSKSEKRYIHLNLKTYVNDKERNYFLEDFEELDKLCSANKQHKLSFQFKSNVTRFQQRLLDILFQFHEVDLPNSDESTRKLRRAKVLIHKGFYRDAFKLLDKIISEENDYDYLTKMEALELKMETAIKYVDIDFLKNHIHSHRELLIKLNKEYANLIEFQSLEALIKLEATTYYFYSDQNELMPSYKNLLSDESNAFHPMAKIYFNKANAFLLVKKGNPHDAKKFAKRALDLFETHPSLKKKSFLTYLKSLRNLCIIYIYTKQFSSAEQVLNNAFISNESFQKHSTADVRTELFTLIVLLRMEILISGASVTQNLDKLGEFTKAYENSSHLLKNDEKASACLNLAIFNFEAGKYRVSLRYILEVLNYAKDVRKDLQHLAYMAEITLHYFLGHSEVLITKINAYKRFLKNEGVMFSFELPAISFLQSISENPHVTSHYKMLEDSIMTSLKEENKLMYAHYIFFLKLKSLY
jgi:hypothetical protein